MFNYRLSLDIGTNSIGWCALDLKTKKDVSEPQGILDMGVRIFPDGRNPKDGSSNAVVRRDARGMRRNRDRFVERRERLLKALIKYELLPKDERKRRALTELDPYELRARGVREKLIIYELGRAIFHLNQRRGFKSNRKSDSKAKDTGPIKEALKAQREVMTQTGAETFGEYLLRRREDGMSVRSRLLNRRIKDERDKEKSQDYYEFYPGRDLMEEEFERLWEKQAKHHSSKLTKEAHDKIRDVIFYQRPLKPQPVGHCLYEHDEERIPKALPLFQRFRIYQEVNNLYILEQRSLVGRPLRLDERDRLISIMCEPAPNKSGKTELEFKKMRDILGLSEGCSFSLESEKRKGLEKDSTTATLSHKDHFGAKWSKYSDEDQERIILRLIDDNDEESLIRWLMEEWGLDRKRAEAVSIARIPDDYGRLGHTATSKILEHLTEDVIPYSEAVKLAGYASHSQFSNGRKLDRLPYYGIALERHVAPRFIEDRPLAELTNEERYGKVTNPTVHIALNQVRAVVNEIIKLYGPPAEVHLEVLRDLKNSIKQKQDIEKEQKKNQDENDKCAKMLREEFHLPVNRENIQRLRLWNELPEHLRLCPYTGKNISARILFTPEVEIDHILPFSRTLDDGMANKVLCLRNANREKANQTPFEAWGAGKAGEAIQARAAYYPKNKRWRFTEDAMERYMTDRDFISRQLTDSQYITRLAREYLAVLFEPDQPHKIVCLPGRLTGLFRHHLGLDGILDEINPTEGKSNATKGEKNRNDHRHHAVDALLIGLMDRSFLQRAATIHAREEKEGVYDFLDKFSEPWPGFRASACEALAKIIVSHKPDHGIQDALHNDTAYGFVNREDSRGNAVHRISADSVDIKKILSIKGKHLRASLVSYLSGLPLDTTFRRLEDADEGKDDIESILNGVEKDFKKCIQDFFVGRGIRHVRIIERIELIPIRKRGDKNAPPYKGFKPDGNAYMNVFQSLTGPQWEGDVVTLFNANNPEPQAKEESRKRIIRLFNRDMLEMEHSGARKLFYIQRMSAKLISLAEHFEANADSRTRDKADPFIFVYKGSIESIRKSKVRFLVVTPAGRIRYLSDDPDDTKSR
jgi:CRISPR-associated endonuclease Csn1